MMFFIRHGEATKQCWRNNCWNFRCWAYWKSIDQAYKAKKNLRDVKFDIYYFHGAPKSGNIFTRGFKNAEAPIYKFK